MDEDTGFDFAVNAVTDGDIARISELVESGFDINSTNENGETLFSYACANNQLDIARLLVTRGANINTIDTNGGSPLDWAVCHSSHEFRAWLVSIGGQRNDNSYPEWPWPPRRCADDGEC